MGENQVQKCQFPDKELGIDFLDEEYIMKSHPNEFQLESNTIQNNIKTLAPNWKREEKDVEQKTKGAPSKTQKSSLSERLRRKTATATLYCSMDESSQSSDNEESFEKEDGKNHKHPTQKDGSIFTLEMIARFLQQDLASLDKDKWENMIKNVHDVNLFQDIISLGNGRRRFKCYKCQKQIHGTPIEMEEHMKHVHSSQLGFGCFFCPLARSTTMELFRHENYHVHWSRNVVCTICDYGHLSTPDFQNIDWPALHQICHPPTDIISQWSPEQQLNWLECLYPGCNYSPKRATIRRLAFAKHVAIHHAPGNKSCVICGERGMNDWKLKTHLRGCMLKQLDPVNCPDCGASMKDARKKHDCKSGAYDCKDCQARFVDPSSLKRHTLNVHGNRKHPCDVCGKIFSTRKSIEDHMNTHTGAKPYQCLACKGWYTSQAGLAMHLRSKHDLTTKQMREKYKNFSLSETDLLISESGGTHNRISQHSATAKINNYQSIFISLEPAPESPQRYNKYTGRKRGRPVKVKSECVDDPLNGPQDHCVNNDFSDHKFVKFATTPCIE